MTVLEETIQAIITFIKNISFFTNFEFSHKFTVKSQIFFPNEEKWKKSQEIAIRIYSQTMCKTFIASYMEDGRSISVFLVYWQHSQGRMANFPAFIASKSFDLWKHHIPQIKWHNLRHISKKYMIILKMCFSVNQIDDLQSSNKN